MDVQQVKAMFNLQRQQIQAAYEYCGNQYGFTDSLCESIQELLRQIDHAEKELLDKIKEVQGIGVT